ncbi:MAG: hypothetical protein AVDCRST_MAG93-105, partial [uncultured Chloroflexia bacterium]
MRTKLTSRLSLLFLSFALVLAMPAMALAVDTLYVNDLVTNGDVTKTANSTGSAEIWLAAGDRTNTPGTPDDAKGCNATTDKKVKVSLASFNTSKVTINSPGFVELSNCGEANALSIGYSVTGAAVPGDVITVSGTATGGQTNSSFTQDSFKITVIDPPQKGTALAVDSASGTYGGSTTLSADLDCATCAAGTDLSGRTINFTLNGDSAGSATTNASGVATKSAASLSGIAAGTYTPGTNSGVAASFSGDSGLGASNSSNILTVSKAAGSVSINNLPNNATFGGSFTPDYTKAGDGTASTTSNTPSVCSVAAGVVSFDAAGTCTLQAAVAEGTNHFGATGAEQTFQVAQASQSINGFDAAIATKTFGDAPFQVSATATSGLPVSFKASSNCSIDATNNMVSITGAGSCTITASQAGNANYKAATSVSQTFAIEQATQRIDFTAPSGKTFGDADFDPGATANSGLAVSYSSSTPSVCTIVGGKVHIVSAGTCTVTASQAGNADYKAAESVTQSFTIARADATIKVDGYTGTYDGNAHGATGSATGVGGADLSGLLNLGASFTNAP